jgi:TetR/AcrR family transcriptional regulator
MGSPRRIAGAEAKNRSVLLDAAERLLLSEGYAAVTSRRVAGQAGLKPQLVHYYFRTMDDLFLAVFQRRAEEGLQRQTQALASSEPLRALWKFSTDATGAALTMEFMGLASHRPAIRAEIGRYSELFRVAQAEALSALVERAGPAAGDLSGAAISVLMTAVGRTTVLERALGLSAGHSETLALVEKYLEQLENALRQADATATATATRA